MSVKECLAANASKRLANVSRRESETWACRWKTREAGRISPGHWWEEQPLQRLTPLPPGSSLSPPCFLRLWGALDWPSPGDRSVLVGPGTGRGKEIQCKHMCDFKFSSATLKKVKRHMWKFFWHHILFNLIYSPLKIQSIFYIYKTNLEPNFLMKILKLQKANCM